MLPLLLTNCLVIEDRPGTEETPVATPASAAGMLTGSVVDPAGAPANGAIVTTEPGGVQAVTDSDGLYAIPRLTPGTYRVVAAADGYAAGTSADTNVFDGGTAVADVALTTLEVTDGILRVRVVGPDGLPLEGAYVTSSLGVGGVTDASGNVQVADLGGTTSDVAIADADGRLWSRTVEDVSVPTLGGADLAVALTGRAAEGTRYAGSTVCAMCHTDIGASYQTTAHARALTAVEGSPAEAFSSGLEVDLGVGTALLSTVDGQPTVTLMTADGSTDTWTVSGFIGGAERGAVPWAEREGRAWPLPVAWIAPDDEHPDWEPGGWTAGDMDAWLTPSGSLAYDGVPEPSDSAESACFGCHATGYVLSIDGDGGVVMTSSTRSGSRWDDGAVGCEACHGPGLDHTSGPLSEKSLRITNPEDLSDDAANDVCGQCHQALSGEAGTPYPWSDTHGLFTPGERLEDHADSAFVSWSGGAAAIPGASSDELADSAHGTGGWTARCADCHDPHGSTYTADLRLEHRDNALCLSCHLTRTFNDSEADVTTHTTHVYSPTSDTESARCTGCHMPATAARLVWSDPSAAGDLSSHRFVAIPPADSLAYFDAEGVDTLLPGEFVPNACQECHALNDYVFGGGFPGPSGDMAERATHEALQTAFEEKYP